MKRKTGKKKSVARQKRNGSLKTVGEVIRQNYPGLMERLSEYNQNRA